MMARVETGCQGAFDYASIGKMLTDIELTALPYIVSLLFVLKASLLLVLKIVHPCR